MAWAGGTRVRIVPGGPLSGEAALPGDKSISHRALILASLCEGEARLARLAPGDDVRTTLACLVALGVSVRTVGDEAIVAGKGLASLASPAAPLDCGNSATTMRLLAGVLAGANLSAVLWGDDSLSRRPMARVLSPLRAMGADASGRAQADGEETAPIAIRSGPGLVGTLHAPEIPSGQVKTALLLAGLYASGATAVKESLVTRDHSEKMLRACGAPLESNEDGSIAIRRPDRPLRFPSPYAVPGDPSSAAALAAAASAVPGSSLRLTGVCLNATRIAFFHVLRRMGADVSWTALGVLGGEPVGEIVVRRLRPLSAVELHGADVPSMIDELPLVAALGALAEGETSIRGARELRRKESDRIASVAVGLRSLGARVEEFPDGLSIQGGAPLSGTRLDSAGDHRVAMALTVAALGARGESELTGAEWVSVSYPAFFDELARLGASVRTMN